MSHGAMLRRSMRSTPTVAVSRMSAARSAMGTVAPQATTVTSSPRRGCDARPGGTGSASPAARVARDGSLRHVLGYRMSVGRSPSSAAVSMPAASSALLGMHTSRPGMCANVASIVCAWKGPRPGRYAPHGASTTTGADHWPSVRQWMVASSDAIWLNASGRKSANCTMATGRPPASARPIAVPTMVDSLSAALVTRPGKSVESPRVRPNTSPFGSSMSWPSSETRGSFARRSRSTSRMASSMVRGSASCAGAGCNAREMRSGLTGADAECVVSGSGTSRARAAAARTSASTSASSAVSSAAVTPSAIRWSRMNTMGSPLARAPARSSSVRYTDSSSALVWCVRRSELTTMIAGRRLSRISATTRPQMASSVTGSRPSARVMGTPRNWSTGPSGVS